MPPPIGSTKRAGFLEELRSRRAPAPTAVAEAWTLAALDETEAAWEALERAAEERQPLVAFGGLPSFDPFRYDPRFSALLERLDPPTANG